MATTLRPVPPGPRGRDAWRFITSGGSPAQLLAFLEETARRYGAITSFRLGPMRVYLLDDAELIGDVLVTQQHRFRRDTGAALLRELVGDGLVTSDEPRHRQRRRLVQPAFHRARIAGYGATMVAEAERMARDWRASPSIDIGDEMIRLTLAIVGAALFGADVRGESVAAIRDVLRRVAARASRVAPALDLIAPALVALHRRFPGRSSYLFPRERHELDALLLPIIERRRAENVDRGDLLSMLLRARDDDGATLDDSDVRNEVVTFVLAGHETTAIALLWTWYLLAQHPAAEARLHDELDRVLGERAPTVDDLPRLSYTTNVFTEAMRLYPPAAAFGRRATETVELGGYSIPRGARIFLSPYVTHRNPRYFAQPSAFVPERWESLSVPKFAYFPFGAGAKMCIGEPFARLEGVLVLATLARHWRLRLFDEAPVGIASLGALRPDRPIVMEPIPRHTALASSPMRSSPSLAR
jgi:cytochrome P450